VETYPLRKLRMAVPDTIERIIRRPALRTIYDQGATNACTGFSASWMASIYNSFPTRIYDPLWLYDQGTLIDGDPQTSPENDVGGYIWAAMEVLRSQGHVLVKRDGTNRPPRKEDGIQSYYWCTSVDDIRTAIWLGRPVVLGLNWYTSFMEPNYRNSRWFIGDGEWGAWLGGHAICCHGARDSINAFLLVNSWGVQYPPVWLNYAATERLLGEMGEAAVAIDKE
jgi:hypothetical protein